MHNISTRRFSYTVLLLALGILLGVTLQLVPQKVVFPSLIVVSILLAAIMWKINHNTNTNDSGSDLERKYKTQQDITALSIGNLSQIEVKEKGLKIVGNFCDAFYANLFSTHPKGDQGIVSFFNAKNFNNENTNDLQEALQNLTKTDLIYPDIDSLGEPKITPAQAGYKLHEVISRYSDARHVVIPIKENDSIVAIIQLAVSAEKQSSLDLESCALFCQQISAVYGQTKRRKNLYKTLDRLEDSQRVAKIGSWEWSKEDDACLWSRQVFAIFGYEADIFRPSVSALIEFAHFAERRRLRTFFDTINQADTNSIEYKALHADGYEIVVRIKVGQHSKGNIFSGVIQDVSEQYRLNNMKEEFISTVSHELRTPLTAIKGSLSLLELESNTSITKNNSHLMDIARKNIDRLLYLVNDILDIEKANSGELRLNLQNIDLNHLVRDAANQMAHYASQFNTSIDLQVSGQDILVNVDKNRITQAILNIISNAIKYSPEGSTIQIETITNNETARIHITDQGEGIPEDMKDRVFEKFTQITSTHKKKIGGSGLGLSIAKVLVDKHGGKIGFYPNSTKGSTFFIELNTVDRPIYRLINTGGENESTTTNQSALVVEDDLPTSKHLRILLQKLGYNVSNAYSSEQAKEMLKEDTFELITVDVMLPDESGLNLVHEINEAGVSSPILVISAVADLMKNKPEYQALDVFHWFTKPFNHHDFVNTIKKIKTRSDNNFVTQKIV